MFCVVIFQLLIINAIIIIIFFYLIEFIFTDSKLVTPALPSGVMCKLRPFLALPDCSFRDSRYGESDVEGQLALAAENAHHAQRLHLTAGSVN